MEMKQDLESETSPTLDKWETLNDVVKYYEEYCCRYAVQPV